MTIALAIIGGAMLGATLGVALMALVVTSSREDDAWLRMKLASALRATADELARHVKPSHPILQGARDVLTAYDTEQGQ